MLIINGKLHTMCGNVIENGFLWIKDGKIAEVGDMSRLKADLKKKDQERTLDVRGAFVMPGIIEAHCHVGIVEEKRGIIGDDCNEGTQPATPGLRAIDAVNPMDPAFHDAIKAGITAVMTGPGSANPVGGQFVFMKTQGRCVDGMAVLEPAALKAALGENPKTAYGDKDSFPSTRMGTAYMIRKEIMQAKRYAKDKRQAAAAGEDFEEDLDMEAWLPVLDKKIPMKTHVHRADDILTAIRIAKEFDIELTLDHCTEGHLIAEEIAKSGFPAIVGPDLTSRSKIEVQNMSFKTVNELYRAGILTAVMTDHPVSMIQYLPLCAGLAVKEGLPMEEGLKAITINAAKICRVEERMGSLEPGKDADIAVFNGNPMETFTRTLYTIIDGEIVYEEDRDS